MIRRCRGLSLTLRPKVTPFSRARWMPAWVRSMIKVRSNSAKPPNNVSKSLPCGVLVSHQLSASSTTPPSPAPGKRSTWLRACKNLGSIYARAQRFDEAQPWLDKAIRLDPGSWSIALDLALMHFYRGELEASEARFAEAIAAAPDDKTRSTLCTHMAYPVLAQAGLDAPWVP
jgi:tetratricopeptide (TPR) repeat protein